MRLVIQRVTEANVKIDNVIKGEIGNGLMVLLGIGEEDTLDDIKWLTKKLVNLRIFDDENGVMNLSIKDINGDILLISQFTLLASTAKGNRPSYIKAAKPDISIPLYKEFIKVLEEDLDKNIQTGELGADMKVSLINNGPVTILIDSKNRE